MGIDTRNGQEPSSETNSGSGINNIRLGLAKRATALFTLGASIFGTAAANMEGNANPDPQLPVIKTEHLDIHTGGEDVVPGADTFRLPGLDATVSMPSTTRTERTPDQ